MDKAVLIEKVLAGIANESERRELQEWIDSDPVHEAEFDLIKAYQQSVDAHFEKEYDELVNEGYWEFKERLREAKDRKRKIRSLKRIGASITTSIILVLIMGFLMNWPPFSKRSNAQMILKEDTFYDDTYSAIFKALEKKYEIIVDIQFTPNDSCKFSGGFSKGWQVKNLVSEVAHSAGLQVTQTHPGHYTVTGVPCHYK